ncbi:YpjP family protein [Microbacteriaceae bacterium 4G12]
MPIWLKKTLVAFITVFTFGLVTPPAILLDNAKADKPSRQNVELSPHTLEQGQEESLVQEPITPTYFLTYAADEAERQSMMKFGTKIGPVIEDEFKEDILPRIEETLTAFTDTLPPDSLQHLALSQNPKGGNNEKIFHVYDTRNGKDLLRFHVRRDNLPQEGYSFDFHYHSYDDNLFHHHELGKIYWGKNTPPQWLS